MRVLAFGLVGNVQFLCKMFADTGAEIMLIVSPTDKSIEGMNYIYPHQRILLNIKKDVAQVMECIADVDVLIENFRPGVLEAAGLSNEKVHELNPKLIYVKLTG